MLKTRVQIYSDGACSPNPGFGGWGVVLLSPRHGAVKELSGAARHSTNNRMELTAAIRGLQALKRPCTVELYTDSKYVCDAFLQGWFSSWQLNGWRRADRKPVANVDLWQELEAAIGQNSVHWHWVKGHSGDIYNSRADQLAVAAREHLARLEAG